MNTGFWEQRLGKDFQTNATFYSFQQVWELRNVLHCHYVLGPNACYREPNQDLSVQPVLLLRTFRVTDHPYVPISLLVSAFEKQQQQQETENTSFLLQIKGWAPGAHPVSSEFSEEPPLTITVLPCQSESNSSDIIAVFSIMLLL